LIKKTKIYIIVWERRKIIQYLNFKIKIKKTFLVYYNLFSVGSNLYPAERNCLEIIWMSQTQRWGQRWQGEAKED